MRIPSGVTDQYIYFVAVDSTDFTTRETGLSTFTVYRSRNGGAAAAMTTPTINETDSSNMPGVYELLLDEDMTIDSGDDSQEMVFHITHAGMSPVTRTIELYRPKITAGETLTSSSGSVTVGTNSDKTGYSISGTKNTLDDLNDIAATDIVSSGAITTSSGSVSSVTSTGSILSTVSANIIQISGDSTAADNLESDYDGTGYTKSNSTVGTVTNVTNEVTADITSVNGNSFGTGAIPELGIIESGTAQAATATTLQLRSATSFGANDLIIGSVILITGGSTGVGQSAIITDWVDSTDTATVDTWTVTPTGTITYLVFASPQASDTLPIAADMVSISGSSTAADNAESCFTGTITTLDGLDTAQDTQHSTTQAAIAVVDGNVDSILVDTGTTLDGKIDTIDSVVDAIKAKTDNLNFTSGTDLDCNVQKINDTTITGNGGSGTEFSV